MNKTLKTFKSFFVITVALLLVIAGFGHAGSHSIKAESAPKEYEIYPQPQDTKYSNDILSVPSKVSLIKGEGIDAATVDHINDILSKNDIKVVEDAEFTVELAVHSEDKTLANQLPKADISVFEEFDSYILSIETNKMTLIGKDTDAVFYGVTTLDEILSQVDDVMSSVVVNDYANTEYRGFIEGFYGIPWSEKDRISLMEFGQENKMNSYIFAPKDDEYHQSKWRKMITNEDLENIFKPLVETGTKTKNRFIFSIHPFMTDQIGIPTNVEKEAGKTPDEKFDEDIDIIIAKFEQLYEIGVRQFALLADDAVSPLDTQIKVINKLDEWIKSKDDVYSLIFTPQAYSGGPYPDTFGPINDQTSDDVVVMYTGSQIIGNVDEEANEEFYNSFITDKSPEGREPYLWLNWPVNDYTDSSLFLGKAEMLQKGTDNFSGLVSNPMVESELSKIGLFQIADYAWNVHDFDVDKSWEDSFKRVDSDISKTLHTVSKHMSYPRDGVYHQTGLSWDESENLAPDIKTLRNRLENGESLGNLGTEMIDGFEHIINDGNASVTNTKNLKLKEELSPYVEALNATLNANINIIKASQAIENEEIDIASELYSSALAFISKSNDVTKPGFKPAGNVQLDVKPGTKYLRPFARDMIKILGKEFGYLPADDDSLDYPYAKTSATAGAYEQNNATEGDPNFAVDNDSSTIFHSPWDGTEKSNLWITLELEEVTKLDTLRYLSRSGSSNGIVNEYIIETSLDNKTWEEVSIGKWSNAQNKWSIAEFDEAQEAKYVRLTAKSTYGDVADKYMTADEIRVRMAKDTEKADKVEVKRAIYNLPRASELTLADKAKVEKVREMVNNLSDKDKEFVTSISQLEAREARLDQLESDRQVKEVKRAIYNLPRASGLTLADKAKVEEVREMVNNLSDEDKEFVTTISQLEAREAKLDGLEK